MKMTMIAVLAFLVSIASASVMPVRSSGVPGLTSITFDGWPPYLDLYASPGFDGVVVSYDRPGSAFIILGQDWAFPSIDGLAIRGVPPGILTVNLDSPYWIFGYNFALYPSHAVDTATSITLFRGGTTVGALSFAAPRNQYHIVGFAGIQSTEPFDSVQIAFPASEWALDDVVFGVPEPSSVLLALAGALALFWRHRSCRRA